MATGLKFESAAGTAAQVDLSNAKIVVYEDGNGNKYTLDASSIAGLTSINDIKLSTLKDVVFKYQLKGDISETTTTGLGSIIGALFATQSIPNGPSVLAEKAVVEAIFDAKDGNDKIFETKIGATFAKKIDLDNKVNVIGDNATDPGVTVMLGKLKGNNQVVKANGSNATEDGAKAILGQLKGNDQVAKIDGSNVTEDGAKAILSQLKGNDQVAKIDGSNVTVDGAKAILSQLKGNDQVVKISELPAKAAEKAVVDAITASSDFTNKVYIKATPADEVYTKTAAENTFLKAVDLGTKAVAEKVLDAKDGQKLVLVEKLGGFLDASDTVYGAKSDQTAKVFLGSKGLKGEKGADGKSPSAAEIIADSSFITNVTEEQVKNLVQKEMSQTSFEIPTSDDAALNWTW